MKELVKYISYITRPMTILALVRASVRPREWVIQKSSYRVLGLMPPQYERAIKVTLVPF